MKMKNKTDHTNNTDDHSNNSDHGGHDDHGDHDHHGNFKEIFLRSLPLGIIIMLLSPFMGIKLFFQFTFPYSDVLVSLLATILMVYAGKPFYMGAIGEFKEKEPGMMALVTMGISVSYFWIGNPFLDKYTPNNKLLLLQFLSC